MIGIYRTHRIRRRPDRIANTDIYQGATDNEGRAEREAAGRGASYV